MNQDHDQLRGRLAAFGCELVLGWHRHRPVAFVRRSGSTALYVVPELAAEAGLHPYLVDHARSAGSHHDRRIQRSIHRLAPRLFNDPAIEPADLDGDRLQCYRTLRPLLADENILLLINDNRSSIVSLRAQPFGYRSLSLHRRIFDHPEAIPGLVALVRGQRRLEPRLAAIIDSVFHADDHDPQPGPAGLPTIGPDFDFQACLRSVHARWFADLPLPAASWSRQPHPGRRLSSIHFGAYARRPVPRIMLHPRLCQAWVPVVFIEYILFHELCHHRQALMPTARERPHSQRFRAWERSFPQFALAKDWERANVRRFLGPVAHGRAVEPQALPDTGVQSGPQSTLAAAAGPGSAGG